MIQVQADSSESGRGVKGQDEILHVKESELSDFVLCWYCWHRNMVVGSEDEVLDELSDSEELPDYKDSPFLMSL